MFTAASLAVFTCWFAVGVVLALPAYGRGGWITQIMSTLALALQVFAVLIILGRGEHHPPPLPPEGDDPTDTPTEVDGGK